MALVIMGAGKFKICEFVEQVGRLETSGRTSMLQY